MSLSLIENMLIEEEGNIIPKMKQMKLSANLNDQREVLNPLMKLSVREQLKLVCPNFDEDVSK